MRILVVIAIFIFVFGMITTNIMAQSPDWKRAWPKTDFSKASVDFADIISGGPPKDGIPAIDHPKFRPVSQIKDIGEKEPVIILKVNDDVKAYPLRVLMRHEIANDEIGGVPVTVTYCPLCNAAIVFDRRIDGKTYDFGVSGKLRYSDMIMYDRQSESWWQQFTGKAVVGAMTGTQLKRLPARVIPFSAFRLGYPEGSVLVPSSLYARGYGTNPYRYYDSSSHPFLYRGRYNGSGSPMSYVVSIEKDAWLLEDIRKVGRIEYDDLIIEWKTGMNSALDTSRIDKGRDIGFIQVRRKGEDGYVDIPYDTTFAFAFKAFHPEGVIHTDQ